MVEQAWGSSQRISSGVPQGSVLGPLLFVVNVSDLPRAIQSSACVMFAENSLIFNATCSLSSPASLSQTRPCFALQPDADNAQLWADQWSTNFNARTSSHMVFCSAALPYPPSITLKDTPVSFVTSTRHLGVLLSSDLKWSCHVETLVQKCGWKVALL